VLVCLCANVLAALNRAAVLNDERTMPNEESTTLNEAWHA